MKIIKYPDKTSYIKLEDEDFNKEKHIFRINTYEDLWILSQFVDACKYNNFIPTIVIPNLIDAQADRRFNSDESSNLRLVLKFLNNLQANIEIFHPHNLELVESLIYKVKIIDNSTFIKKALLKLLPENKQNFDFYKSNLEDNLILMSSDAGGFKPLIKLVDKINWKGETSSASKSRRYENQKSILTQVADKEDYQGKNIFIIDDICVYGGTFLGLAKILKQKNIGKIYLAVSHMTVENPNPELFEVFDKVFTTDSKGLNYFSDKLEIIKLF